MRIGIITRHLDLPVGMGAYARNLLPALAKADPKHEYYIYTPRAPKFKLPRGFVNRPGDVPEQRSKLSRWEHWEAPRWAKRDNVDLIHYLHLANSIPLTRRPIIVTAHDAIQWAEPGYRLPRPYDLLARRDLITSSHVITVSHAAKLDLNRYRHVPLEKISVTHEGPALPSGGKTARTAAVTKYLSGGKFFLFVGGTERRKNLRTVLEAYAQSDFPERLAIIGPTNASPISDSSERLTALLTPAQRRRVKFLGRVSDADLDRLYRRALAFVFPSRYEGFGLPVLEAMQDKTPVITSNVSSLPEVAGDAALLIDPDDANAVAGAMESVRSDSKLRTRLVRKGLKNVKRFSWQGTAEATLAVYERMVPQAGRL